MLAKPSILLNLRGAETQNRTGDTRIFSPLLYRLSYLGTNRYSIFFKDFVKNYLAFLRLFYFSGFIFFPIKGSMSMSSMEISIAGAIGREILVV
jgi:hypothetical protein